MTRIDKHEVYQNGVLIFSEDVIISDEQIADENERAAFDRAEDLIDAISNLAEAKVFLKRLIKRLIRNGVLP